jgi:hypothetical protein
MVCASSACAYRDNGLRNSARVIIQDRRKGAESRGRLHCVSIVAEQDATWRTHSDYGVGGLNPREHRAGYRIGVTYRIFSTQATQLVIN